MERPAFGGVLTLARPRCTVGGALGVLGTVDSDEEDIVVVVVNFCAEVVNRNVGGGNWKGWLHKNLGWVE